MTHRNYTLYCYTYNSHNNKIKYIINIINSGQWAERTAELQPARA